MRKVYIVAVDMGYGHQRAVFPLEHIGTFPDGWKSGSSTIISANIYEGRPDSDKKKWEETRKIYEWVSKMRSVPYLGTLMFSIMDYFQRIPIFYPKRNLSKPSLQVRQIYRMIEGGFGKHLIDTLNKNPLPLLTSFFIPAFFAEEHGYKGDIYCLCTDTDISRAWAPLHPEKSRIIYLAPNHRVKERLMLYGVREEKIIVTGFPLPIEALGEESDLQITKEVANRRIYRLDPKKIFKQKYDELITKNFGEINVLEDSTVSLTFAIGGAGAQAEIGEILLKSLKNIIADKRVRVNLIVGTSKLLFDRYTNFVKNNKNLCELFDTGLIKIIYKENKFDYFREFNKVLVDTDVLWTKPSELSFYAGLGLPIIIAPPLGSQEEFNREWLYSIEAGVDQGNPKFTNEWFLDLLNEGRLAEMVLDGFLNAPKKGTYRIEKLLLEGEVGEIESIHSI